MFFKLVNYMYDSSDKYLLQWVTNYLISLFEVQNCLSAGSQKSESLSNRIPACANYTEGMELVGGTVRRLRSGRSSVFVRYGNLITRVFIVPALLKPLPSFWVVALELFIGVSIVAVAHLSVVGPEGW